MNAEKGRAHVNASEKLVGRPFKNGNLEITIQTAPHYDEGDDWLIFDNITATRDSIPLTLDLPFTYRNPPLKVSAGVDHFGVPQFREDHAEALRQMIAHTVMMF